MNLLLAGLLLTAPDPASGQPVATHAASGPPLPSATSPAARPRRRAIYELHLAIDIPVTVAAGSVALVRILFRDQLVPRTCPCDPSSINAFDRGTVGNHSASAVTAADVTVYGVMAALPVIDLFDLGFGRTLAEDLMVYVETIAIDTALQNATNFLTARPRPRTYAGDPDFVTSGEGYLSFYAGHVATAFATLSMAAFTIRNRHGEQVWPWIVAGLIGSSVAVERVASGDHFPSDVAVAAVVGTAIGIAVPWLHLRHSQARVAIVPMAGQGAGVIARF
jgi:membrane-associated phospholipid phosphatase